MKNSKKASAKKTAKKKASAKKRTSAKKSAKPQKTTVRKLLMRKQKELITVLEGDRDVHDHPTDLGDATELNWVNALSTFLPARYQVAKAKILDADDKISEQVDVVIFDRQYCPLFLEGVGTSDYIPAESVYAVFEVKQDLSKSVIEYAAKKIASVRRLRRTNGPVYHASGVEDNPRPVFEILGGVIASGCTWKEPFGSSFEKAIAGTAGRGQIDIGCALKHGGFDVTHRGGGGIDVARSYPDVSLMFFLMQLFMRLQRRATVPVIELDQYARSLRVDGT